MTGLRSLLLVIAAFTPLLSSCQTTPEDPPMGELQMKESCEKCDAALGLDDEAYVCTHECTFCPACTRSMDHVCPNCQGRLEERPRGSGQVR